MAKFIWNRQDCINHLNALLIDWLYSVSKVFNNRSNNQNSYYWGVVVELLRNYIWETADDMHDILKYKFLKDKSWKHFKIKDTKSLTTKEFDTYCENIRMWAAMELWLNIPEPNETETKI